MSLIPRFQLFEFQDLAWLPRVWHELLTDIDGFFAYFVRPYGALDGRLRAALQRTGARAVVDLCSGTGWTSWTALRELPDGDGGSLPVQLTDQHPRPGAWRRVKRRWGGPVGLVERPVDAAQVPAELDGFRTLFTAFHHFDRDQARAVLRDAATRGRGIAVFEYTERSVPIWGPAVLLMPVFLWAFSPFIHPFRWTRLLWTYVIPVVPLLATWDALASCLRSYDPDELLALAEGIGGDGYTWESGRVRSRGLLRATFLIGTPRS